MAGICKKLSFFIIYKERPLCYDGTGGWNMERFLETAQFVRHFPSLEDSFIRTVGYDDFRVVKPLRDFRMQSFYTWHFVLSGSGILEIGGRRYTVREGQMFFIPPSEKMRYYPREEDPWEYVWFSLTGDAAASYGARLGFSVDCPVQTARYFAGVRSRLKKLFTALTEEGSSVFGALSAFYGILELCTADAPATGIHGVKKYIDESFALPGFSVAQLCYDAGLSHAHLLRLFRQAYGMPIIQYVIKKRINLACELLTTTDLSVRSVAFSCGFTDEPHFMKTFKREMGTSALQYRKGNSQKP